MTKITIRMPEIIFRRELKNEAIRSLLKNANITAVTNKVSQPMLYHDGRNRLYSRDQLSEKKLFPNILAEMKSAAIKNTKISSLLLPPTLIKLPLKLLTAFELPGESGRVGILKVRTDGQAPGNTCNFDTHRLDKF